ncbi:substrate-binding periplasmic protein [Estrella lausannensis]|uniref:ABC-type transporter, substrate-binding protein n=1 Tax=Estrella lausannensis TaxID=483423 RepID=A0A0H5DSV9_9BACT|nr:transporter substrate-binding domain-containing protein [Estrella lausannensis]CRX38899.1 ABC-type transporter, substrate-binding protein [Estrella lausannensis]
MPWLKEFWKAINKNRTTYIVTLAAFGIVSFALFFFLFRGFDSGENFGKNKTFKIARDPNLYPIQLAGKERNLSAFTNELIFKLAKDKNIKIQLFTSSFNFLFEKLKSKEFDAIVSTMAPTPLNRQQYLFSLPFFEVGPVLVVRHDSQVQSIDDLRGKAVGIKRGDSILVDKTSSGILFVPYDSHLTAFDDLETKKVEGVILPASAAQTFIKVFYSGRLKVASSPLREEGLRLVAEKTLANHFLIETFNKALKEAMADGTYDSLLIKWSLVNPRMSSQEPSKEE